MPALLTIIRLKLSLARNRLRLMLRHRRVQVTSYAVIVTLFFAGGYVFFLRVFTYLAAVPEIGEALSSRILEMAFLTFLAMLFLSSTVGSLATLFRAQELPFFFSRPVPANALFVERLVENTLYSSWATALLAIPLVVSYGVANDAAPSYYAWSAALFVPFLLIPSGLGVFSLLGLTRLFPRLRPRDLLLIVSLIAVLGLAAFFRFAAPQSIMIRDTEDLARVDAFIRNLGVSSSPLLPSGWLSQGLLAALRPGESNPVFEFLLLLSTAAVVIYVLALLSKTHYARLWLRFQEASTRVHRGSGSSGHRRLSLPIGCGSSTRGAQLISLAVKDVVLFLRDPSQWSQAAILVCLLAIYLGSIRTTPLYHLEAPFWRLLVCFANFAFTGYILATLSVRFSYPTMSLEGKAFWLLGSSPLSRGKILAAKYLQSFAGMLAAGEALTLVSGWFLRVPPLFLGLAALILVPFCSSLAALSVGLGSAFLDTRERNPAKIASNSGAILTALIALLYVGAIISLAAWPSYIFLQRDLLGLEPPPGVLVAACLATLILSTLATSIPLAAGLRSLRRRDF